MIVNEFGKVSLDHDLIAFSSESTGGDARRLRLLHHPRGHRDFAARAVRVARPRPHSAVQTSGHRDDPALPSRFRSS
ncbi:MAG: hypothetical protein WDN31_03450 [Hyphomicrobium sp.]